MRVLWLIFFSLLISRADGFVPYYATSSSSAFWDQQVKRSSRNFKNCPSTAKYIESHRQMRGLSRQGTLLTRKLPFFNTVCVMGNVHLEINGGETNKIAFPMLYKGLSVKVCGRCLSIRYKKPPDCIQNTSPLIRLTVCNLESLVAAGSSCIIANHVKGICGLTINSCCNDRICLNGVTNLVQIVNTGNGSVCARNVETPHLEMLATRCAMVRISGCMKLLFIRAFQNAIVDTRFATAEMAMVQAQDRSLVTVKAIGSLRAFASGMSNIYYFAAPNQLFQHSLLSGNVLPML